MKKVYCVLLSAVLCILAFGSLVYADPKAFDYYGFYDPSGKFSESERDALNATLKRTYDKYGVSVYLCLLSGESVKMSEYVLRFYDENINPRVGVIKRGVIFAWDEKTNDFYAAPFPRIDDRMSTAFSPQYLTSAASSSFTSASSTYGAFSNIAGAVEKRVDEYYGANAVSEVTSSSALSASDSALAKAAVYTLGGEEIPSIYGAVGARELFDMRTGRDGDTLYLMAVYMTNSIEEDGKKYFMALNNDGWTLTNQEGNYNKGSASVAKRSKDEGFILAVTVLFKGTSYQVNAGKLRGTLDVKN